MSVKDFSGATASFNTDLKSYIDSKASALQTNIDAKLTATQGAAVADLNQTISVAYTQSEVQALSDKVDELLGALRAAGIIAT